MKNATGEPATPTASQDADGSSAEESEEHTTDATAAEGDETITTAPVSVDEALSSDAEPSHMRPESERTRIRGHGIHRRSVADLQQQVYALFDKFVPANSSQASGDVDPEARTIVSRELPALLDEFERQRGTPLIEPEMKPQLDAFAQANPDVIIPPAMLVQVISGLQEALNAGNVDANGSPQRDILSDVNRWSSTEDETSSGSSHSSPPPSPTPTQRRSFPRSGTLPELASSSNDLTFPSRNMSVSESPEHAFPRSTSDYSNLGGGTGIAPRQKTTSDPSSPLSSRRQSAPLGQPANSDSADRQRRDSHRERRVSGENKDVLSGKGRVRAPPSAWSRPKPQALASRSRRISDTDADSAAKNDDDDQPTSASARPERRRQSSQPINPSSPTGWFGPGGDAPSFPRSVSSSAFVFPRAISPNSPQDDSFHGYSARNADWNAVSGHGGPGSGSSRAGSPGLDETSFQPFRSLSAQALAAGGEGGSTRESASGHKPRADPSDWVDSPIRSSSDQLVVLQRKYDSLQRTLVERERALDRISEMQDEAMNDLQAKLEEAKAELGLRTKEAKDAKAAEKDYLDLISRHDTEMTKLQDELDQQMAITQKSRKENDKLTGKSEGGRNRFAVKYLLTSAPLYGFFDCFSPK